ncbi:MAG: hypothetical protein AAF532_03715 [Planctomycetota bacterium]
MSFCDSITSLRSTAATAQFGVETAIEALADETKPETERVASALVALRQVQCLLGRPRNADIAFAIEESLKALVRRIDRVESQRPGWLRDVTEGFGYPDEAGRRDVATVEEIGDAAREIIARRRQEGVVPTGEEITASLKDRFGDRLPRGFTACTVVEAGADEGDRGADKVEPSPDTNGAGV